MADPGNPPPPLSPLGSVLQLPIPLFVGHWVLCCPAPLVHVFNGSLSHISFCKNKLYSIYVLPISSLHRPLSLFVLSLEFVFVLICLRSFSNKHQCSSIIHHVPFCGQLRPNTLFSYFMKPKGHCIFMSYLVLLGSWLKALLY